MDSRTPCSDLKNGWDSIKSKNLEWAEKGVTYVKCLRAYAKRAKDGHDRIRLLSDAIKVCEKILENFPSSVAVRNEYGWCLYYMFVRADTTGNRYKNTVETATKIITLCEDMEPSSPYVQTCLWMVRINLSPNRDANLKKARAWLDRIDEEQLDNEAEEYLTGRTGRRGEGKLYHIHMYRSQLRDFLELKAHYLQDARAYESAILTNFRLLDKCENSKVQFQEIQHNIWINLQKLYDLPFDKDILSGSDLGPNKESLDKLLEMRGFTNQRTREAYRQMLQRRFQSYAGWIKSSGIGMPRFETDNKKIAIQIAREILIPPSQVSDASIMKSKPISASNLANFSFCPASYAIQETYDIQPTPITNIGTLLHEKQLLVTEAVEKTKKMFLLFAERKIDRESMDPTFLLDDEREAAASLPDMMFLSDSERDQYRSFLEDVASSKLIFHGHDAIEKKMFFNESGSLVGSPDYIFEREDGTRFVVEEKFSFQTRKSKPLTRPYTSHRMQLGTYAMLLQETEASYAYLLYWSYSFDRRDRGVWVNKVQPFRLACTESFKREVLAVSSKLQGFRKKGFGRFNVNALNCWKCVNCVTTDLCVHKTGTLSTLRLPYTEPVTSEEKQDINSVFSSLLEAKPFAQESGRAVVRNPNGSGFILKM